MATKEALYTCILPLPPIDQPRPRPPPVMNNFIHTLYHEEANFTCLNLEKKMNRAYESSFAIFVP